MPHNEQNTNFNSLDFPLCQLFVKRIMANGMDPDLGSQAIFQGKE